MMRLSSHPMKLRPSLSLSYQQYPISNILSAKLIIFNAIKPSIETGLSFRHCCIGILFFEKKLYRDLQGRSLAISVHSSSSSISMESHLVLFQPALAPRFRPAPLYTSARTGVAYWCQLESGNHNNADNTQPLSLFVIDTHQMKFRSTAKEYSVLVCAKHCIYHMQC